MILIIFIAIAIAIIVVIVSITPTLAIYENIVTITMWNQIWRIFIFIKTGVIVTVIIGIEI